MKIKRLAVFILSVIAAKTMGCAPLENSALRDTRYNFSAEGFITRDIYQTHCLYPLENKNPGSFVFRKDFITDCREQTVRALTEYKIRYEVEKRRKLDRMIYSKRVPVAEIEVIWTPELVRQALDYYADLFPGEIVYEASNTEQIYAIYRIEKEDLLKKVQKRPPPFELHIVDQMRH